jgi:hypothetical protein
MLVPSALLVVACVLVGILPAQTIGPLLAAAGTALLGEVPAYELAIWHGFTPALLMSFVAFAGGIGFYRLLYVKNQTLVATPFLSRFDSKRMFDIANVAVTRMSGRAARWLFARRLQPQLVLIVASACLAAALPLSTGGWLTPGVGLHAIDPLFAALWVVGGACAIGAAWQAKFPPKSRAIVEPEPRPAEPPAAQSPAAQPPRQADPPPSPPPPARTEPEPTPAAPAAPAPLESFLVAQPVALEPAPPRALVPTPLPREPEPLPPPLPTSVKSPAPTAARPPTNRQWLVAQILAAALAAAALFAAAPAAWDVVLYARAEEGALVSRWALAAIALAAVQLAYAAYLAQLPDWSSGWIVTLWSLAAAAGYAGLLGLTLIAGPESRLIQFLDLADVLPTGRASMWCLCMTTIMASLAFFAGRTSLRWRQAL